LHGTETSRRCAEGQRAIRETREITPIGQRSEVRWQRSERCPSGSDFASFGVFSGRSRSAPQWPKRPLSKAPKC